MKLTRDPSLEARGHIAPALSALAAWYDATPAILRLWAIQADGASDASALRVVVMLEPSVDGDDTDAAWMAHGGRWMRQLRGQLAGAVDLECLDGPLPDEFEIDGEGLLLSTLCWRDATAWAG